MVLSVLHRDNNALRGPSGPNGRLVNHIEHRIALAYQRVVFPYLVLFRQLPPFKMDHLWVLKMVVQPIEW